MKTFKHLSILFLAGLLLASCGSDSEEGSPGSNETTVTVTTPQSNTVPTYVPTADQAYNQYFNTFFSTVGGSYTLNINFFYNEKWLDFDSCRYSISITGTTPKEFEKNWCDSLASLDQCVQLTTYYSACFPYFQSI